jgi:heme-degrading monooxygenase HmoA
VHTGCACNDGVKISAVTYQREVPVHARLSTYQTDDPDGLVSGFEAVTDELEQVEGFSHAYFLVDRGTGKAASITIWESEDALNQSVAKADELRRKGTQPSGASIASVDHFEVVHRAGSAGG